MSSRASMTTRANTANAKSKPWPAKQRPWGTRWWRWAHPRCRASTPSPHRPPELGQHDTAGPSPVWGKGGVSLLLGRAPAGRPQTTANDSRSPRFRPTLTAVLPWQRFLTAGWLMVLDKESEGCSDVAGEIGVCIERCQCLVAVTHQWSIGAAF